CKNKAKGTSRYQTNKDGSKAADRSSTSNLMKHATKCWGGDVVKARMQGVDAQARDGSIFSAFARAHERPALPSDRTLSEAELRHILGAGRPEYRLPGRRTVSRDLYAAYERCLLLCYSYYILIVVQEYPGRLSFGTDAWTSPNHRAFVAWTVHLHHEGELISFPLDVYEVPEVSANLIVSQRGA
ncbi:hypothetical protein GGX14DRAFT_350609, partial [Mycena pura]